MPDKREEFGAVWARTTRDGRPMLSGRIGGVEVVAFPGNDRNPAGPAWRFYESTPRPDEGVKEETPEDDSDLPF